MTYTHLTATVGTVFIWQSKTQSTLELGQVVAMLKYQGCRVVVFDDVEPIANAVVKETPDLVLIQVRHNESEVSAFCQFVREQAMTNHLPLLFVGNRDLKYEQVQALRCGANGYLQLPLSSEESWLNIERHIQTAQLFSGLKANLNEQTGAFKKILRQQQQRQTSLTRENEALQRMAFIDGLTQVANRRSFNKNVAHLWQAASDSQRPISLLLCDIDYFKRYNDTYGHLAGDDCLQRVAEALVKGAHRYKDQVARYGGEEFAILLPDTDTIGAQRVATRVHQEIAKANIPHRASLLKNRISLSIGLCTRIPTEVENACAFINRADKALYAAKVKGRDRTVIDTDTSPLSVLPAHRSYEQPCEEQGSSLLIEQLREQPTRDIREIAGPKPLPKAFWSHADRQVT